MKYFFILGTNRALSLAELFGLVPEAKKGQLLNNVVFLAELSKELDVEALIKKMGGIIKIGKIVAENLPMYGAEMSEAVKRMLAPGEGKYKFGISNYAKFASPAKDKRLAMNIKNYLKEKNISCRWVIGKETILSSVIVEQNIMNGRGIEIVIAGDYKKCFVGYSLVVQAFKDLASRDYGRPNRDDHSGMLPPKLAQIMINLSGVKKNETLLDPFCGSGTIITEAMMMGITKLIGSDLSEKAIEDSRGNIAWIKRKYNLVNDEINIFKSDVRNLNKEMRNESVDAIVMEPYLGPQRGEIEIKKMQNELHKLYSDAIAVFEKILTKKGRVVMIWPVRVVGANKVFLSPLTSGFRNVSLLDQNLKSLLKNNYSSRGNIIYGREGQKVWREIVVLERI